jgi:Uma2 family endonuclease
MSTRAPIQTGQAEKPEGRVSFEEWLAWAPASRLTEWRDGEIIEMSPISRPHDLISQWLIGLLRMFIQEGPVGVLRAAPTALKLTQTARGREPDLMFLATEHRERDHLTFVEGPVDAVWEIISPESEERDREDKFVEYEAEGIPEYWLIDPQRQQLELYHLGEDGHYRTILPREGRYESAVIPGFYLRAEWLWADPQPRYLDVMREFGVL